MPYLVITEIRITAVIADTQRTVHTLKLRAIKPSSTATPTNTAHTTNEAIFPPTPRAISPTGARLTHLDAFAGGKVDNGGNSIAGGYSTWRPARPLADPKGLTPLVASGG